MTGYSCPIDIPILPFLKQLLIFTSCWHSNPPLFVYEFDSHTVNWAWISYHMRERQKGVEDMNIKTIWDKQNCAWIKVAHKTKTVITKGSSASFMVWVCKLNSCSCNVHAGRLISAFMDQQHRCKLFHSTKKLARSTRIRGTSAISEHGAWPNCIHCLLFR